MDTLTPYMLPARAFRAIVIVAGVSFIPALVVVAVFESAPDSLWLDRQRC